MPTGARGLLTRFFPSSEVPQCAKQDVVYLHMFPRRCTKGVVNLSPFAIKLETWLRLHSIPFEVIETSRFSRSTGQIPYIILNGEEYADSGLIIQHLTQVYGITEHLTAEQRAVCRAFTKMLDDHTVWTYLLPRYNFQNELFSKVFRAAAPWPFYVLIKWILKSGIRKSAHGHGIGRKPPEVIAELGKDDIRALSDYLGSKKFMMGDIITELDCAVFGHLSQLVYVDFPYAHKEVLSSCTNILPYMERIRTQLWRDWDRIVHSGTFW